MNIQKSLHDGQQLRFNAEERLKGGNPPPTPAALTETHPPVLLHILARSLASAGDVHKLLQELQVHQVEQDLQHEQAKEYRQQLDEAMQSYAKLFESAPVNYLTQDAEGRVVEANHIAAAWLEGEREQSAGRPIEDWVHAEDRLTIHDLMRLLRSGSSRQKCLLRSKINGDAVQAVISATGAAIGAPVLLALMPAD